jgi:hypothetical protein
VKLREFVTARQTVGKKSFLFLQCSLKDSVFWAVYVCETHLTPNLEYEKHQKTQKFPKEKRRAQSAQKIFGNKDASTAIARVLRPVLNLNLSLHKLCASNPN